MFSGRPGIIKYRSNLVSNEVSVAMSEKKISFFSRLLGGRRKGRRGELTPDDIRRKLEGYRNTDGPAQFGAARIYSVQEADEAAVAEAQPPAEGGKPPAE